MHKQVKKQLLDSLKNYIERFYGVNPKESKDFGRIVNEQHTIRLTQLIDRDKVVIGGDFDIENRYIAPTVLDRVGWDDPVMADEIFGPILPVLEFESLETADKSRLTANPNRWHYICSPETKKWKKRSLTISRTAADVLMIHLFIWVIRTYLLAGLGILESARIMGKAALKLFLTRKVS